MPDRLSRCNVHAYTCCEQPHVQVAALAWEACSHVHAILAQDTDLATAWHAR